MRNERTSSLTHKKHRSQCSGTTDKNIVSEKRERMFSTLSRANPSDVEIVMKWEESASRKLVKATEISPSSASIKALCSIATYYENIGNIPSSLNIANLILKRAVEERSAAVQRRGHNLCCALYSRVGDHQASFSHAEQAFKIATETGDAVQVMATLSNTSVTLFSAGLKEEAKKTAFKAARFPSGGSLDYLHLINSSNGIKFSHDTADQEAADQFYNLSKRYFECNGQKVSAIAQAYHKAFTAEHLVIRGEASRAASILEQSLRETGGSRNVRILALLHCASASSYLALNDLEGIKKCEAALLELLPLTRALPFHHEELLRILIRFGENKRGSLERGRTIAYERRLQEYILASRHGHFFEAVARSYANSGLVSLNVQDPQYQTPKWIEELCALDDEAHNSDLVLRNERGTPQVCKFESHLRSRQYDIAEDWAVAAEFLNGGSWRHCFGVGELSRVLALQSKITPYGAAQIGLAARLHDIGKVATVEVFYRQCGDVPLNEEAIVGKHAEAGASLLSGSSDLTLQMAAKIARSHHEWWNGCGQPMGLKGEEIPIEARICAVADVFVALVRESDSGWSPSDACLQISSMSGVQLDPSIVSMLLEIVQASGGAAFISNIQAGQNNLLRTKKRLFEALELNE